MAKKYIQHNNGELEEKGFTVESAGVSNAGDGVGLDNTGHLHLSIFPSGIGPEGKIFQASETVAAGNLVNLWNDAGNMKVRKADASDPGKYADGFVLAGVASDESVFVYFDGIITGLTGLTKDARYFLSGTAPGNVSTPAPTASGYISQFVGKAISDTEIAFEKNGLKIKLG